MGNMNGNYCIPRTSEGSMIGYDELPPPIRRLLQNACMSISNSSALTYAQNHGLRGLELRLNSLVAKNAKLAYGPDHPQAQ